MSRIVDQEDLARLRGSVNAQTLRTLWAGLRGFRVRLGTATVVARIDAGRWVADCPLCNGAEIVSKSTPIFFCMSCGMASDGGKVRLVTFPADITATEAAVADLRVSERNWSPY